MARTARLTLDGRKDPTRGDAVLPRRPESWAGFFRARRETKVSDEFLAVRRDEAPQKRPGTA